MITKGDRLPCPFIWFWAFPTTHHQLHSTLSHWGQLKSLGQPGSFPELFPPSQLHANESFLFGLFSTNKWIANMQIPKQWQWRPTLVLLPGKSHGWRSLVGCGLWGSEVSDMTEWLHFHFSLSCTGEGNGNPLQCSCLENPRDGGAWWAALYGLTESDTTEAT